MDFVLFFLGTGGYVCIRSFAFWVFSAFAFTVTVAGFFILAFVVAGYGFVAPVVFGLVCGLAFQGVVEDFVDSSKIDGFFSSVPLQPVDGSRSDLQSFCSCWTLVSLAFFSVGLYFASILGPSTSPFCRARTRSRSPRTTQGSLVSLRPRVAVADGDGGCTSTEGPQSASVLRPDLSGLRLTNLSTGCLLILPPLLLSPPPLVSLTSGLACNLGVCRSVLGETYAVTRQVLPIRGHLDGIKRMLVGDYYIVVVRGRGVWEGVCTATTTRSPFTVGQRRYVSSSANLRRTIVCRSGCGHSQV